MLRSFNILFAFSLLRHCDAETEALVAVLPLKVPPAKPIPFRLGSHVRPDGENISVDSRSLWLNGRRWIPVSGEIHYARVPAAQWREELLKMKAGGLDSIGVYSFWNHHQEKEGQWSFAGRRNLRKFVQIAHAIGLKVLMRVGPWCHGEARNGGHPDWLVQRAKDEGFALRSNNSKYLSYVARLYEQLAKQLDGLWWDEGGPIYAMQVDNETPNWQYLLALRDLAIESGMRPPVFTKTGWPTPSAEYPKDYPMLPFFGGYQDNFWNNDMHEDTSETSYFFGFGPSLKSASLKSASKYTVPEGYPWLDIEIGGGMGVAYNHRTYMSSADMPSSHLVFLASGVNGLGYYMYHGGNNPHSAFGDDPEKGLQESGFQPAGAGNPMPSLSYDFFAPLGEFGQPRRHYHQMRRLHLFVQDFGLQLADMVLAMPIVPPRGVDDNTTLRWAIRSDGKSGFLFINNYQRLSMLPRKTDVRFQLVMNDGHQLSIPHPNSSALTIGSGVWTHWPFNLAFRSITLTYATAQVFSFVSSGPQETMLVLVETKDVPIELAFHGAKHVTHSSGTILNSKETAVVIQGLAPGMSVAASARADNGEVLKIIVLPHSSADQVWKGMLAGKARIVVSDAALVLHDSDELRIHATTDSATLAILPAPASLNIAGVKLAGISDGAFTRYTVPINLAKLPPVTMQQLKKAGPAREVPSTSGGKAMEPSANEWKQAAVWSLALNASAITDASQVRLAIRYRGDAARMYAGETLLTDNWFTGYNGDGQMEVGLSYLADEVPELLGDSANLTLHMLPLRKDSLETNVFIDSEFWPDFGGQGVVASLDGVDVLQLGKATINAQSDGLPIIAI